MDKKVTPEPPRVAVTTLLLGATREQQIDSVLARLRAELLASGDTDVRESCGKEFAGWEADKNGVEWETWRPVPPLTFTFTIRDKQFPPPSSGCHLPVQ